MTKFVAEITVGKRERLVTQHDRSVATPSVCDV